MRERPGDPAGAGYLGAIETKKERAELERAPPSSSCKNAKTGHKALPLNTSSFFLKHILLHLADGEDPTLGGLAGSGAIARTAYHKVIDTLAGTGILALVDFPISKIS